MDVPGLARRGSLVATDDEEREEDGEETAADNGGGRQGGEDGQGKAKAAEVGPVVLDDGQTPMYLPACGKKIHTRLQKTKV